MRKMSRSTSLCLQSVVGVDPESEGLKLARQHGIEASASGVEWLLRRDPLPDIVFEATSAAVHRRNAPRYQDAGITAVDLTPAAIGQFVVPTVNLEDHIGARNVNMITCGGQATIPIVAAVSAVTDVPYAEIVASIASRSAGPGTRANIEEFTRTTSRAIEEIGGATRGKAIVILNPAEPPLMMRDTVFCAISAEADQDAVTSSITAMVEQVQKYVPGYRLLNEPQFDPPSDEWGANGRVSIFLEVRGAGDFLPAYAGNLDIMTSAALRVGERLAVGLS
jgi:acetaldehyde dehydrogenase